MTTYKIGDVLTDLDGCSRVKMQEDPAGEWVRKEDVQKLLRKQREAEIKAACELVMEMLNYETDFPYPEIVQWAESIKQAILNANAEVEL